MSCGAALVASDTKPLHEAIIDKETGLLTPFFDPQQLAQQVIALLDDPARRQTLGRQAREFAIEHFDLTRVSLPRLLSIIERYR